MKDYIITTYIGEFINTITNLTYSGYIGLFIVWTAYLYEIVKLI